MVKNIGSMRTKGVNIKIIPYLEDMVVLRVYSVSVVCLIFVTNQWDMLLRGISP